MPNVGARNGTEVRGSGDVLRATSVGELGAVALDGAGEITATVALAKPLFIQLRGSGELAIELPPRGSKKRLVVTDVAGGLLGELENAEVGSITEELNRPTTFGFSLPAGDAKASLVLEEEFREVQLWRGDVPLSWGPITRPAVDSSSGYVSASVRSADWHLLRRVVGPAARTNLLTNGDFEEGRKGWNILRHAGSNLPEFAFLLLPGSSDAYYNIRKAVNGNPVFSGTRSAELIDTSPDGKRPFIFQDVEVTTGDVAEVFTFTAYAWIDSGSYVGPNVRDTGLVLGAAPSSYRTLSYPGTGAPLPPSGFSNIFWAARNLKFLALDFAKFGPEPDLDRWIRLEASIVVPANQSVSIQARLEGVRGSTFFDRCRLVRSEGLHFAATDQADIAKALLYHAQGMDETGTPDPDLADKSDVNIVPAAEATGVLRDRSYLYSEHANVFGLLEEFFGLRDGFDYRMTYTPTERRFELHYPEAGRLKPKLGLELGRNVASFAWTFDGESAASSVIVLGEGSGDGREEHGSIDPDAFAGGLTLEAVLNAPEGTPILGLEELGDEELARSTSPHVLAVKTRPHPRGTGSAGIDGPELIPRLRPGDFVPVRLVFGALTVEGTYRVVRKTITPGEELELVLNNRGPR